MSTDASEAVLTEVRGRVLLVTLNRPAALNAVNADLAQGFLRAIDRLDGDDDLVAGVVTGAGRAFCSGMDLKAFSASGPPEGLPQFLQNGSTKPLIAAVEGLAVAGGLELALTCDLLVSARDAYFGIPEVGVGLFAAGGALFRLPQRMPYGIALEMALTAEPISAEDAYRYGLVNHLTDKGGAAGAALELAERIARNAPLGIKASRHLIQQSFGRSEKELWDIQAALKDHVFHSNDAKEGARAFAEKRKPHWSGS